MESIPIEVLRNILEKLVPAYDPAWTQEEFAPDSPPASDDILKARLVCRAFNENAWEPFARRIAFRTLNVRSERSIRNLKAIASKPQLAKWIHTLTFGCGRLSDRFEIDHADRHVANEVRGWLKNLETVRDADSCHNADTSLRNCLANFRQLRSFHYRLITMPYTKMGIRCIVACYLQKRSGQAPPISAPFPPMGERAVVVFTKFFRKCANDPQQRMEDIETIFAALSPAISRPYYEPLNVEHSTFKERKLLTEASFTTHVGRHSPSVLNTDFRLLFANITKLHIHFLYSQRWWQELDLASAAPNLANLTMDGKAYLRSRRIDGVQVEETAITPFPSLHRLCIKGYIQRAGLFALLKSERLPALKQLEFQNFYNRKQWVRGVDSDWWDSILRYIGKQHQLEWLGISDPWAVHRRDEQSHHQDPDCGLPAWRIGKAEYRKVEKAGTVLSLDCHHVHSLHNYWEGQKAAATKIVAENAAEEARTRKMKGEDDGEGPRKKEREDDRGDPPELGFNSEVSGDSAEMEDVKFRTL